MGYTSTYSAFNDASDCQVLSTKYCDSKEHATAYIRDMLAYEILHYLQDDTMCTNHPNHIFYPHHLILVECGVKGLSLQDVIGMVSILSEKDLLRTARYRKWHIDEVDDRDLETDLIVIQQPANAIRKSERIKKLTHFTFRE